MGSSKPPNDLKLLQDASIDEGIMASLPVHSHIVETASQNYSEWSSTLRLDVKLEDNSQTQFFLKVTSGELGRSMAIEEFESMMMLNTISPEFVVEPVAWGVCSSAADTYFFISEFHDIDDKSAPNLHIFCKDVSQMHTTSANMYQEKSCRPLPEGKFGFHVTTYLGMFPKDNHRRQIRPTLVHGDLQIRNARTDLKTNRPVLFDGGAFWGHNEYDIAKWVPVRYNMGASYLEEYHKHIPRSEPVEDYEDRMRLYTIHYNLVASAHYPVDDSLRQLSLADMRILTEKYRAGNDQGPGGM
ncbi:hypothetical protein DL98DRAFT_554259 [Cadophora sp. DSE1049]|nr:hypothetical protein DL98DRAFT_554259 [Cadophora sp. DSE1049]